MNLFHREFRRAESVAERGYAWTATRNERTLGVLLWTVLFALLVVLSR